LFKQEVDTAKGLGEEESRITWFFFVISPAENHYLNVDFQHDH
jgi:hypothetical protein